MTSSTTQSSIIKTYSGEMYIVKGATPAQVRDAIKGKEFVEMPNGDQQRPANIASIISRESYHWQEDQKARHKRGQRLVGGSWSDGAGHVEDARMHVVLGTEQFKQIRA